MSNGVGLSVSTFLKTVVCVAFAAARCKSAELALPGVEGSSEIYRIMRTDKYLYLCINSMRSSEGTIWTYAEGWKNLMRLYSGFEGFYDCSDSKKVFLDESFFLIEQLRYLLAFVLF